jgi:predicted RNA-binding protein associated with RNAse of E/G family
MILRMRRLPEEVDEWEHVLLLDTPDLIISEFRFSGLERPTVLEGRTITENGYRGVLFEFAKEWYEIMKIWNFEGGLVGYYCNINTPPKRFEGGYEVTDLFLDLWVFPDLEHHVLDEDEFEVAIGKGWIDIENAEKARETLDHLVQRVKKGEFPPGVVEKYV